MVMVENLFENSKKFLVLRWVSLIAILAVLLITPYENFQNFHSICISKLLFEKQCWGCGMLRAFNLMLSFQFEKAYQLNKLSVIVAPIVSCIWLKETKKFLKEIF